MVMLLCVVLIANQKLILLVATPDREQRRHWELFNLRIEKPQNQQSYSYAQIIIDF